MSSTEKKPTVKDVAALANVSTASVSRYLNNVKGHLSKKSQEKIANAIQMLNYVPNMAARQMVKKKSYQIALLVVNANDRFSMEIFKGASSFLEDKGYQLVLLDSDSNPTKEKEALKNINRSSFDGILYQPLNSDLSNFKEEITNNIPTVILDRQINNEKIPQVISENFESAAKMTNFYISKGITNIVVVSSPIYNVSTRVQRLRGIRSSIHSANLQLLEVSNFKDSFRSEKSRNKLFNNIKKLINPNKDNLLFFLEERFLLGIIPMLLNEQSLLKNKIQITGFVDSPIISWIFPQEHFIHQQPYVMGTESSQTLWQLINGQKLQKLLITINSQLNLPIK